MSTQKLLTIREASAALALQPATLRRWVLERRISYAKIGRAVRIPADAVEAVIQKGYRPAVDERT
jgi:excisionase family DNA binding protein